MREPPYFTRTTVYLAAQVPRYPTQSASRHVYYFNWGEAATWFIGSPSYSQDSCNRPLSKTRSPHTKPAGDTLPTSVRHHTCRFTPPFHHPWTQTELTTQTELATQTVLATKNSPIRPTPALPPGEQQTIQHRASTKIRTIPGRLETTKPNLGSPQIPDQISSCFASPSQKRQRHTTRAATIAYPQTRSLGWKARGGT